jgi:basic membrane protein A
MKFNILTWFLLTVIVISLTACGGTPVPAPAVATEPPAEEPTPVPAATEEASEEVSLRVALILPGPADDTAWSQAAYESMQRTAENADVPFDLNVVENVFQPVDIEPAVRDFAQQGYDLIIGHGFQFHEPMTTIAPDFPEVNFAIGTGFMLSENVGIYDLRLEQCGYTIGTMAAQLTESNVVAVVGGLDVAELHRGHVGHQLGAKNVSPDITTLYNFPGFYVPEDVRETALSQVSAGADVLWHTGGDGVTVMNVCQEEDVKCMGIMVNLNQVAPENVVASCVYNFEPVYTQMIGETAQGTFGNKFYWLDFAGNGLEIVFNEALEGTVITDELHQTVDEIHQGFTDGSLDLGDLNDQQLE